MKFNYISISISGIAFIYSFVATIYPVNAQQELCRDIGEVAPLNTLRTLELPQFGINIDIPENYRAMIRNNSSVQILNPGNFELVSCIARGGKVLFGRGMSTFTISLVKNPKNLSLLSLSQQSRMYDDGYYRYNLSGTQVIIKESSSGSIGAWFAPPKIDGIVMMEISCDCQLSRNNIVMELNKVRLR